MKYCVHCGAELLDEAVVCPKCGCPTDKFYGQNKGYQSDNNNYPYYGNTGGKLTPLAIVGFVFAFIVPLVGLICSILAYKSASVENSEKNKNFTKAGIIISAVFLGITIIANIISGILIAQGIISGYFGNIWDYIM